MKVVFMGSPEFAVPALRSLLGAHEVALSVSQPDKPAGRGRKLSAPAVVELARAAGIAVSQPRSARAPEFAAVLRDTGADIGVVVAYGKILPRAVLEAFPRGCINIHGSLLPAYRGAAPIQWAIIRGEIETGITIMQLDEGMDTGPMLKKRAIPIRLEDTAGTLAERLAPLGAELLLETLAELERGELVATPQEHERASYAPMLEKEHGRVRWSDSSIAVANLVRGVDPWPGAFTWFGGATLKLFGALPVPGQGHPGALVAIEDRGMVVACASGAVLIREVQAPGKKRMPAGEFARGRALRLGQLFGDDQC
jgi:methionyl-tRNA formyltransferase